MTISRIEPAFMKRHATYRTYALILADMPECHCVCAAVTVVHHSPLMYCRMLYERQEVPVCLVAFNVGAKGNLVTCKDRLGL